MIDEEIIGGDDEAKVRLEDGEVEYCEIWDYAPEECLRHECGFWYCCELFRKEAK